MPILRRDLKTNVQAQPTAADRRAKATALLPDITDRVQTELTKEGLDIELSFVVPNTGDAILLFGTATEPDPSDDAWEQIGEIVCAVVRDVLGVQNRRQREIACSKIFSS